VEEERSTAERAAVNQGSYDLFFFFFLQVDPRRDPVAPVPLGVSSYANTALRDALKLLWRPTPDRLPDARPATPRFADFPPPTPTRSARLPGGALIGQYLRRGILEEITSTPR